MKNKVKFHLKNWPFIADVYNKAPQISTLVLKFFCYF
jgi:hypothetical protein